MREIGFTLVVVMLLGQIVYARKAAPSISGPAVTFRQMVQLIKNGKTEEAANLFADKDPKRGERFVKVTELMKAGNMTIELSDVYPDGDVASLVIIQRIKGKANASLYDAVLASDGWKLIEVSANAGLTADQQARLKPVREKADAREKELDRQLKTSPAP